MGINQTKVLLVEDDPEWKVCLKEHVARESDMTILATAANRQEAVEPCRLLDFDIVLACFYSWFENTPWGESDWKER